MQIVKPFGIFNTSILSLLIAWLQSITAWLLQPSAGQRPTPPANAPLASQRLTLPFQRTETVQRRHLVRPASSFRVAPSGAQPLSASRLRVVREHDAVGGRACAGRMVISGRMADVCAELDRMAQRETASS